MNDSNNNEHGSNNDRTLKMTSGALTNAGKERHVKHCMCELPAIHKRFSLLIDQNDILHSDIT